MKKRKKTILLILALVFLWLIIGSQLDKRPNNPLAKAIKTELGDRVIWSKKNGPYTFIINDYSNEVITDIVNAANNYLKETQAAVHIRICEPPHAGRGISPVAYISNFVKETGLYDSKIVSLNITKDWGTLADIYSDPLSYTKIKNIKELHVTEEIDINALYRGIDWYEVWPDLERFSVGEIYIKKPDDSISKAVTNGLDNKLYYLEKNVYDTRVDYEFLIMDFSKELITDVTDTVNNVLSRDGKEHPGSITPVTINLCVQKELGGHHYTKRLAVLSNFHHTSDGRSKSKSQLIDLKILDVTTESSTHVLNSIEIKDIYYNADSYVNLKGIKSFTVNAALDESARAGGIDWYEVWPDLKRFSVDEIYIKKPDDSISKAVTNGVDNKLYYLEKNDYDTHVNYEFLIMDFSKELITDVTDTVNEILSRDGKGHPDSVTPVTIYLCVQTETGGSHSTTPLALLSNFSYDLNTGYSKGSPQLTDIEILDVANKSPTYVLDSTVIKDIYYNADSYVNLKGIKSFSVNAALDKSAKTEGIDWYEVWSDLENYTVLPTTSATPSLIPDWSGLENFSTKPGSSSVE